MFSTKLDAKCHSIEEDIDFTAEIQKHDTIAFCYPIYDSRVPLIMRIFVHKHMADLIGKKIIILVTQMAFSGDGARVLTDMFDEGAVEVIYAEHFNMQQNMGNFPVVRTFFRPTAKSRRNYIAKTDKKMAKVSNNIKNGIVKKRGFSKVSIMLGYIQGKSWQKDTKSIIPVRLEKRMQ
ncbi:MAG: hypothetical protein FWC66_09760, partial [Oscillospiraceae bacterium]|nr:hypothetical protein [Oscillospiraceae bacterium]